MAKFLIVMCLYGIFATATVLRCTCWVHYPDISKKLNSLSKATTPE